MISDVFPGEANKDRRWWKQRKSLEVSSRIYDEVKRIDTDSTDIQNMILESCALYGDLSSWPQGVGISRVLPAARRISHNVIANAVDALVSEVTQTQPRPMAITVGGSYRERKRAEKLTKYWEAKFDECNVHEIGRQCVRDSILCGIGIIRPYRENPLQPSNDRTRVERIFPGHFLIDDRGSIDVMPRECYVRRFIDRAYLSELFPRYRNEIEGAKPPDSTYWFGHSQESDVVEVIECWHLASLPGSGDGLHVIAIENRVLFKEIYDRDRFPMAFVRPVPPQRGFRGESLVRRAAPAQLELNKLLRRIQESMHLHAVPRVFLQRQAGVVKAHMQNDVGAIVEYDGNPPIFLTPASMGKDVYQHIQTLERWIYKEMGVSELSANSVKPAGLDSGAALRTYNDVQSRRWINLERSYETMHVELARELVHLEQEIAKEFPKHEVTYEVKRGIKKTYWKDIHLDHQRYRTRVFSASALPNTPAGKLQALEEMVKVGIIDQQTFIMLADVPDLEAVRDLKVAPRELLEERFDSMLEGGEYTDPEPYMDLQLGIELASVMIQRAELQGAKEHDVEKLRTWIGEAIALPKRAMEQAHREMEAEAQMQQMEAGMQSPTPPPEAGGMPADQPGPELTPGPQAQPNIPPGIGGLQ